MANYFFQTQTITAASLQLYYEPVLEAMKKSHRHLLTGVEMQELARRLQDLSASITDGVNERRKRLFGKLNYDHPAKPAPKVAWVRRSESVSNLLFDGLPVGLATKVKEDDDENKEEDDDDKQ